MGEKREGAHPTPIRKETPAEKAASLRAEDTRPPEDLWGGRRGAISSGLIFSLTIKQ